MSKNKQNASICKHCIHHRTCKYEYVDVKKGEELVDRHCGFYENTQGHYEKKRCGYFNNRLNQCKFGKEFMCVNHNTCAIRKEADDVLDDYFSNFEIKDIDEMHELKDEEYEKMLDNNASDNSKNIIFKFSRGKININIPTEEENEFFRTNLEYFQKYYFCSCCVFHSDITKADGMQCTKNIKVKDLKTFCPLFNEYKCK